MRILKCGCAIALALALTAPTLAQNGPRDVEAPEIIVKGTRDRDKQVSDFIGALADAPVGGQLSRFEEPVCPAAIGFSEKQNQAVAARIRSVASAVGVRVGEQDCKPNLFVVVAEDKNAIVKEIRKKWTDPLGDRVQVPKQDGLAVALHLEGMLDANGVSAGAAREEGDGRSNFYTVEMGSGSSRLKPVSRPHFLRSALIVEAGAVAGLTTTQMADYAAMRLLARVDPSRLQKAAPPTILNILDAPMGSEVPVTLTHWDVGFLKGLYGSGENRYANQQRKEMQQVLNKELQKGQTADN
jgi:hypothetical protein